MPHSELQGGALYQKCEQHEKNDCAAETPAEAIDPNSQNESDKSECEAEQNCHNEDGGVGGHDNQRNQ